MTNSTLDDLSGKSNYAIVYALIDPRDDQPFYVGVTTGRLCNRLGGHVADARRMTVGAKAEAIRGILDAGFRPCIQALEPVTEDNWAEAERSWIRALGGAGSGLTNVSPGGVGEGVKRSALTRSRIKIAAVRYDLSHLRKPAVHEAVALKLGHPVVIEGVRYRSVRHAASVLGVAASSLRYKLGLDHAPPKGRPAGDNHPRARAVEVEGRKFATVTEAARAHMIHPGSMIGWIKKGRARYADVA